MGPWHWEFISKEQEYEEERKVNIFATNGLQKKLHKYLDIL